MKEERDYVKAYKGLTEHLKQRGQYSVEYHRLGPGMHNYQTLLLIRQDDSEEGILPIQKLVGYATSWEKGWRIATDHYIQGIEGRKRPHTSNPTDGKSPSADDQEVPYPTLPGKESEALQEERE